MRRTRSTLAAIAASFGAATGLVFAGADPASSSSRHPGDEETYSITAILQVLNPVNPEDMSDDFQDVRVIKRDADSCTVEVKYFPLHRPPVNENPRWREEDAAMVEYLRPTPTENWDDVMRHDLLVELRAAGIDPERLTDKKLVEQVSRWAMKRARSTNAFAVWTIYYPDGKPTVYPPLRDAFERQKSGAVSTDEQLLGEEVLGRSMFYNKVHGSCTSSAIYLTTIFRALGIPTRIVFCIPPFDPNDAAQAEMFYRNIHHHQVRETVRTALDGMTGFDNHLFNEVYVGHRWVRLNYSTLAQPILDAHYFGLLTHILTSSDMSQVPLAQTWGMRYFKYPAGQPKLSSPNPYRLISISDNFGANSHVDNPPVPSAELRAVTIVGLYRPDAPQLPTWLTEGLGNVRRRPDFIMSFKEWVAGTYLQMRAFEKRAGHEFLLTAAEHPDVRAHLSGSKWSKGDGSFQAFGLEVAAEDKDKLVTGVAYKLSPINTSDTYFWQVAPDVAR